MKSDSDLTMAVNATFNAILNEIQLSKFNFSINLTPYAAYVTLKKSTLVDLNGEVTFPSPPSFSLLEDSFRERVTADTEIERLKAALLKMEEHCNNLKRENISLRDSSEKTKEDIKSITRKYDSQENELTNLRNEKKKLEADVLSIEQKYSNYVLDSNRDINAMKKLIKSKEKEVYNLTSKFNNSQDTISNLKYDISNFKSLKSKLEKDLRKLEQKIEKVESRKQYQSVALQTLSTADIPYDITDPLPPIFGSKDGVDEKFICNI